MWYNLLHLGSFSVEKCIYSEQLIFCGNTLHTYIHATLFKDAISGKCSLTLRQFAIVRTVFFNFIIMQTHFGLNCRDIMIRGRLYAIALRYVTHTHPVHTLTFLRSERSRLLCPVWEINLFPSRENLILLSRCVLRVRMVAPNHHTLAANKCINWAKEKKNRINSLI